jgi:hypothetical protein
MSGMTQTGTVLCNIAPRTDGHLARVLLDLQRAAHVVEATLIGDHRIPPLHETYDELRSAALTWRGAFLDHRLVGQPSSPPDRTTGPPTSSTRGWASSRPGSVRCCPGCGSPSTGTIPASAELRHPLGDAVAGMSLLPRPRARPCPSRGNDPCRASSATVPRAAAPRTAAIERIAGRSATGRRRRMWTWHRRTPRLCASRRSGGHAGGYRH